MLPKPFREEMSDSCPQPQSTAKELEARDAAQALQGRDVGELPAAPKVQHEVPEAPDAAQAL